MSAPEALRSSVLFDAVLHAVEPSEPDRRVILRPALEWLETVAAFDLRSMVLFPSPTSQMPSLEEARHCANLFGLCAQLLERGMLADELAKSAPELLVRYAAAFDTALDRLRDLAAIFDAHVQESEAIARGETTLEQRLHRALTDPKPRAIDLGSFAEFADDE